jgi:hypothetical protein
LWGDDECPDIDVKCLLLAYLYVINWKGGSLFPSKEELENPPEDGVYKTFLSKDDLYHTLDDIFTGVLKREDKLGAHTSRKSGYLFGKMCGAISTMTLMMAAFHDCHEVAQHYCWDAEAIMEVNRVFNDPKQCVGTWKSPHCEGDENAV